MDGADIYTTGAGGAQLLGLRPALLRQHAGALQRPGQQPALQRRRGGGHLGHQHQPVHRAGASVDTELDTIYTLAVLHRP